MSSKPQVKADKKSKDANPQEHPDATYIKRDDIGVVIAKGMAQMYKNQPKNPVDFLAKWLLNYAQVERVALSTVEHKEKVKDLKDKFAYQKSVEKKEEETKLTEEQEVEKKKQQFYEKIGFSTDLTDQLQDLADFLKHFTNSTAVYIGKLVSPKRPIKEDDDDKAHLDEEAAKIIHFLKSTTGHEYLVDQVLKQEQGLTFDVFRDDEPVPEDEQQQEEGEGYERPPKEPEEILPKFVYIKEVVREPRMHFYAVPRLGSYLAIRLEYESCLYEEALDVAVSDYAEMRQRVKEQEEEKRQYYEKIQEEQDPEREGEGEFKQDRQWEEIKPNPFRTQKVSYVVCLNTMGQDREYSEDEIKMALRTCRDYRDRWEQVEKENLEQDILLRIKMIQQDKEYKENFDHPDHQEMERLCEEVVVPKEGEEPIDDDTKQLLQRKHKFKLMTKGFYAPNEPKPKKPKIKEHKDSATALHKEENKKPEDPKKQATGTPLNAQKAKEEEHKQQQPVPGGDHQQNDQPQYVPLRPEQWKKKILAFKKFNVIKMPRVFQTVFYLLKYSREEICERDTNMIEWKKAKNLITEDFFKRIGEYNPFGPKHDDYRLFQQLKFLKKNIERFEPEHIDEYSTALGKLFRWLLQAVDLREEDVQNRRDLKSKLKEERRIAIEHAEERERLREQDLNVARAEFEAKEDERIAAFEDEEEGDSPSPQKQRRNFDENAHLKKWDEENPSIDIPAEIVDDIDNDYDLEEQAANE